MEGVKPIGYWLKHLDNLLERQFDAVLADVGLSRREWQVLNTLSRNPEAGVARGEVADALTPFWTDDRSDLDEVVAGLAARGWVRSDADDVIALTGEGRAVHADVAIRVRAVRSAVTEGLTPEQYEETVRVLSIMAGNVEAALASNGSG
ncbi:DNA-binding transcriptional regulator, MarR family [Thermostaphylospora chromogena]|uniref:DNA-binding transcriptional regulator, MarR family n=2 Tax=Thermostaphylospora chromogena TaxID=35622 RepID=A0A1H1BE01_9ACTN|nr:DNA-binding transcriptional regulator, MarR family [Thermostaphylospora chromogena]